MYDYKNKKSNVDLLNKVMLLKTLSMFQYKNLPSTIPQIQLEKMLQQYGYVYITEVNGELYAFNGTLGGELDVYGEPTEIIITNPALNFSKKLNIETDGVLIQNDDLRLGLYPLFEKYNALLIENEITMFLTTFNNRINSLLTAPDDTTKESAELYLKKVVDGELGIIGENQLWDGLRVQNTNGVGATDLTKIIEFNQYLKATLYNEVGLNANFNMKRERLNSSEVELNTDNLYPIIDNMFDNRRVGLEELNEKYGLNVEFDFDSIWNTKQNEKDEVGSEEIEDTSEHESIEDEEQPTTQSDSTSDSDESDTDSDTEGTSEDIER